MSTPTRDGNSSPQVQCAHIPFSVHDVLLDKGDGEDELILQPDTFSRLFCPNLPAGHLPVLSPGDIVPDEPPAVELGIMPYAENPSKTTDPSVNSSDDNNNSDKPKRVIDLNYDVVVDCLSRFLDDKGPHQNVGRVLLLNKGVTSLMLQRFHRELYIVNQYALDIASKTLAGKARFTPHVHTLHFGLSMLAPFTQFRPITGRLLEFRVTKPISAMNWPIITDMVLSCSETVESLAFAGAIVTEKLAQPILAATFTLVTELVVPIQFLHTPNSPLVRRTPYDPENPVLDTTWPNLRTLSVSILDPTDFLTDMDLRMEFRHLAQVLQIHVLFRFLDSECVSRYLRHIKVLPSVQCISVEITHPEPSFPLYNTVTDAYFFDPRVVFIQKGPMTPHFNRLIRIYARHQACAVYDLLLILEHGPEEDWEVVLNKVEERREFAIEHQWTYPKDTAYIVQTNAGPFVLSLMEQLDTAWSDEEYIAPLPLEAITFDVYHSWI
ncbi:hypothetical protein V5O48_005252 [Marasmius crinis-equi]|uniref:Uncharacterized protein n=1 Tax=Marasmius crinis-equi TaxID=585013 RepID=A0ABR3FMU5_9AGAR